VIAGKKVAVVGGAGFIGHHLALALVELGATVEVVDSLQVNNVHSLAAGRENHVNRDLYLRIVNERLDLLREADIPLTVQDARDYHALAHLLADMRPDVVVHAAAVSHAGRSNKDPYSTFDHSLRTLENSLDYSRDNVGHFVFLSSSMAYGNFLADEVTEDHPLDPIGIYGALKLAGEKIVIAYQQVFDLPYTIVRPSALYGPRCISRRVGQVFIENALAGEQLLVQGDGSDRLDFTYIEDLIQGLCLVIERPEARNEVFNITYGEARPIRDIVTVVRDHYPEVEVRYEPRDALMPERGTLSVEKARRLLGYAPANPIEVGFAKYIEWYRELVPSPVSR
jgi:nucleoside-diphosphate-sugar epimerase